MEQEALGTRNKGREQSQGEEASKAQAVLKPGTSRLVNIPRSAKAEPAAWG